MTKPTKFLTGFTKEEKVIGFIKSWLEDKGYPPSVREIGNGVGLKSTKAVKYHLDNLVAKGQLTRKPYHARTLELKKELIGLPLVGRIAVGTPTGSTSVRTSWAETIKESTLVVAKGAGKTHSATTE